MVFPGHVGKLKFHIRTTRKTNKKKTKLKKDWGVLVDKKWNMSELCIFEAIITLWTMFAEAQLPNQGMLLLLPTQVIHMGSSILHSDYRVSRVRSKKSASEKRRDKTMDLFYSSKNAVDTRICIKLLKIYFDKYPGVTRYMIHLACLPLRRIKFG